MATQTYAQWTVQQLPTSAQLHDMYFSDTSNGWIVGGLHLFHTTDGGNTWNIQASGMGLISGLSASELWTTGYRDTILHTIDGGNQFIKLSVGQYFNFDSVRFFHALYFYDSLTGWVSAQGWKNNTLVPELIKTSDGGYTWINQTLPNPDYIYQQLFIQFLDREYGLLFGDVISQLYRSMDGGITWDSLSHPGYVRNMDMQFLTKRTGWVSIDGQVLTTGVTETMDSGKTWGYHFLDFQCSDLTTYLRFTDTSNGWVVQSTCVRGDHTEIWHTSDGGTNWDLQFTYTPSFYYRAQKVFFVDKDHGWIGGENGVLFHTSNGGKITAVDLRNESTPKEFILRQNYPNPFNPSTSIEYELVHREYVTLTVYDAIGKKINTLVNQFQEAGKYRVRFNGNDLSSGVYYYRLKAGEFLKTKEMTLLK